MSIQTLSPVADILKAPFDASIKVAGFTLSPGTTQSEKMPTKHVVLMTAPGLRLGFTPAEACALAAALQAVAIHVLETEGEAA